MPCPLCDDGRTDLPACGYCGPALVVGGVTRPMPKSKAEDLAEWDRRMAEARASVSPVNPAVPHGAKRRAKTQRRSSKQVKRAAKRQMAEREALARKVSPPWLKEGMQDEEDFLAMLRDENNNGD